MGEANACCNSVTVQVCIIFPVSLNAGARARRASVIIGGVDYRQAVADAVRHEGEVGDLRAEADESHPVVADESPSGDGSPRGVGAIPDLPMSETAGLDSDDDSLPSPYNTTWRERPAR